MMPTACNYTEEHPDTPYYTLTPQSKFNHLPILQAMGGSGAC
jgi:hypothetical protein